MVAPGGGVSGLLHELVMPLVEKNGVMCGSARDEEANTFSERKVNLRLDVFGIFHGRSVELNHNGSFCRSESE